MQQLTRQWAVGNAFLRRDSAALRANQAEVDNRKYREAIRSILSIIAREFDSEKLDFNDLSSDPVAAAHSFISMFTAAKDKITQLESKTKAVEAEAFQLALTYTTKREAWSGKIKALETQLSEAGNERLRMVRAFERKISLGNLQRRSLLSHAARVLKDRGAEKSENKLAQELSEERFLRERSQALAEQLADEVIEARRSVSEVVIPRWLNQSVRFAEVGEEAQVGLEGKKGSTSVEPMEPRTTNEALSTVIGPTELRTTKEALSALNGPTGLRKEALSAVEGKINLNEEAGQKASRVNSRRPMMILAVEAVLAGHSFKAQRESVLAALSEAEALGRRTILVLRDEADGRPAFRGLYTLDDASTDENDEVEKGIVHKIVNIGSGPAAFDIKNATSLFSWSAVEKRLVRLPGSSPASFPESKEAPQTPGGGYAGYIVFDITFEFKLTNSSEQARAS